MAVLFIFMASLICTKRTFLGVLLQILLLRRLITSIKSKFLSNSNVKLSKTENYIKDSWHFHKNETIPNNYILILMWLHSSLHLKNIRRLLKLHCYRMLNFVWNRPFLFITVLVIPKVLEERWDHEFPEPLLFLTLLHSVIKDIWR